MINSISKEDFDEIYKVLQRLLLLSAFRGLAHGRFSFKTKWYYRKQEYVFGVTMKYERGNLKLEDYACVSFDDSDKNRADKSDFTNMSDEISAFQHKISKLDNDFKPINFDEVNEEE